MRYLVDKRRRTSKAPFLYKQTQTSVAPSYTAQYRVLPYRAMRMVGAPLRRWGRACALPRWVTTGLCTSHLVGLSGAAVLAMLELERDAVAEDIAEYN